MINASKTKDRIGFKAEIGNIFSLSDRELSEVINDSKLINETYKVNLNSVEKLEIFLDFLETKLEENLKDILEIKVSFATKAKKHYNSSNLYYSKSSNYSNTTNSSSSYSTKEIFGMICGIITIFVLGIIIYCCCYKKEQKVVETTRCILQ